MSILCKRRQKRLLADLLEGREPSRRDREHLDRCEFCRSWYARQQRLDGVLGDIPRAEPPGHLDSQVMAFIYRQEEARQQAPKVRPRRRFALPTVLHREAWPIALATLSVVWGLWISPVMEVEGSEKSSDSSVVGWVTSLPKNLDQRCANLQREIAERLATIVEPTEKNGDSSQTSDILAEPVTIT